MISTLAVSTADFKLENNISYNRDKCTFTHTFTATPFLTHLLMVLLVERENVGFSMSSNPRCMEMLSNAAFLASIAARYSEVCRVPRVGFRYLKQYHQMIKDS